MSLHYHVTMLGSHLTCPLPPHHKSELLLVLEIELELVLEIEIELALALDIECYHIVGVSCRYTDHYQGRGHSIRPTAALINIHEHLI